MLRIPLPPPTNHDSSTSSKKDCEKLLPASYCSKCAAHKSPRDNIPDFLAYELSVQRLNDIYRHLWMAGRPRPARALHQHIMLDRHITITEQTDLHLLWQGNRLYIKPLPRFLLSHQFWMDNLIQSAHLYRLAFGFLVSYVWLVPYETDFHIAQEIKLLPTNLSWTVWSDIVSAVLAVNSSSPIDKRYNYGELRLGRINSIYRFMPGVPAGSLIGGYHNEYNQYGVFFRRNFAWLITVFAFTATVLAAMQVGLGTDELGKNRVFQETSKGFAIFSIVVTMIVVVGGITIFSVLFIYHLLMTIRFERKRMAIRG